MNWLFLPLGILIFFSIIGLTLLIVKKFLNKDFKFILNQFLNKKHKIIRKMLAIIIILVFITFSFNMGTRLAYIKDNSIIEGKGEWKISNTQKYLYIEAEDRYSLGYLEGKFLANQIINFKSAITLMGLMYGKTYWSMINEVKEYIPYISEEYILEMQAMADGASHSSGWIISLNDIILQNTFLDLSYGKWISQDYLENGIMGCTSIGAKNSDGSVVIGQNFDFPMVLGKGNLFSSLSFVHTKLSGKAEIFGMRLGAMLSLPIAKTSYGLTAIVTVIEDLITPNLTTPATIIARKGLEISHDLDELITNVFDLYNLSVSFTNIGTNGTEMKGIQVNPLGYRINENSTIVHTNRYIYDDWNLEYFADGNYSLARQTYVERLVKERFEPDGILSYEELLEILGTREDGIEGEWSAPCYQNDPYDCGTLAVFTTEGFALGTVYDGLGIIPI